ncbi:MAG: hypothetical protein DYG89_54230 [Caldilinea sp. CFX5]|nr:hypothetical protein [Caldilinea sp. CFX5]
MSTPIDQALSADLLKQILQMLLTLPAEKLPALREYLLFLQANANGLPQANGNDVGNGAAAISYDILLTRQANDGYLARPVLMPELVVAGKDEQEALARVREALAEQQTERRVVHITLPTSQSTEDDPWLRFAGMWQDDPNWEQFLADIASYRQAVDAQTDPDLLPLPE